MGELWKWPEKRFVDNCQTLKVNCFAMNVPSVARQPQKKGTSLIVKQIKCVKGVSCVDQLSSVQPVTNVHTVAQDLRVGARLNLNWEISAIKVLRIIKEGYTLPFHKRVTSIRSPIVKSGYFHPLRNSYLMEALHALVVQVLYKRMQ